MTALRIGSVPYLNAKPLVAWLHSDEAPSDIEVVYAVPSELAVMLRDGLLDVAMVSTFELFRNPGLLVLPDVSISADGPVRSVRLLSRVPIPEIRTVALDSSSLTSVNLVRIILTERYGLAPDYASRPPNIEAMLDEFDACVIIGDLRLFGLPARHVLDLGEEWKSLTGLPFTYAAWLARTDADVPRAAALLRTARAYGEALLEELSAEWSGRMSLPLGDVREYFLNVMRYDLDASKVAAIEEFRCRCLRHGLIQGGAAVRYYEEGRLA